MGDGEHKRSFEWFLAWYQWYSALEFPSASNLIVDANRDGQYDDDPASADQYFEEHTAWTGAMDTSQKFHPWGALVFANLDFDENNLTDAADGPVIPAADTIRFYHDGRDLHATDENFQIKTGEDKKAPFVASTSAAVFQIFISYRLRICPFWIRLTAYT